MDEKEEYSNETHQTTQRQQNPIVPDASVRHPYTYQNNYMYHQGSNQHEDYEVNRSMQDLGKEEFDLPNQMYTLQSLPKKYRCLFSFPSFNKMQSVVWPDIFNSDNALVVSAPTGSGKTIIFDLAIIKLLEQNLRTNSKGQVLYMGPVKALVRERFEDWRTKYSPLGLNVMEVTGDSEDVNLLDLNRCHVILTTPEKWDAITRTCNTGDSTTDNIRLFLIDEVHLLNDETRGPTLEAVVSRMKTRHYLNENEENGVRLIAVSATIPNIEDLAQWLGTSDSPAVYHKFDESYRPVELRKVVKGYYASPKISAFKFDMNLSYKLDAIIRDYSGGMPTLIFCSTRKAVTQTCSTLSERLTIRLTGEKQGILLSACQNLQDNKLRELVKWGLGYHHAGILSADRFLITELFTNGHLPVLVATSTLAMGVNLPAHLVVIKSTEQCVAGVWKEYSEEHILQMIGRAGRPQFNDRTATAVIMTKMQNKVRYERLVSGKVPVESHLHKNLTEHLNAEICLSTVTDIAVAVRWLKSTYLYVRALKNPTHYSIQANQDIHTKLQDLCVTALNALEKCKLIVKTDFAYKLESTDNGRLMATHCISFESMKIFLQAKGEETLRGMLELISKCTEFDDVHLRVNERSVLNTMNKGGRQTIRFPLPGKITTKHMKVNCLIQAVLGCLNIEDVSLRQESIKVVRIAHRLSKGLAAVLWQRSWYRSLHNILLLRKCLKAKMWENSPMLLKQLPSIGPALAQLLVSANKTSFQDLIDSNPRDIERVLNRHPPLGNHIKESAAAIPQYNLELILHQSSRLYINITLLNIDIVALSDAKHYFSLLVADNYNNLLSKERISDAVLRRQGGSCSRQIYLAGEGTMKEVIVSLISETFVGVDKYAVLKLSSHQTSQVNPQSHNDFISPSGPGTMDKYSVKQHLSKYKFTAGPSISNIHQRINALSVTSDGSMNYGLPKENVRTVQDVDSDYSSSPQCSSTTFMKLVESQSFFESNNEDNSPSTSLLPRKVDSRKGVKEEDVNVVTSSTKDEPHNSRFVEGIDELFENESDIEFSPLDGVSDVSDAMELECFTNEAFVDLKKTIQNSSIMNSQEHRNKPYTPVSENLFNSCLCSKSENEQPLERQKKITDFFTSKMKVVQINKERYAQKIFNPPLKSTNEAKSQNNIKDEAFISRNSVLSLGIETLELSPICSTFNKSAVSTVSYVQGTIPEENGSKTINANMVTQVTVNNKFMLIEPASDKDEEWKIKSDNIQSKTVESGSTSRTIPNRSFQSNDFNMGKLPFEKRSLPKEDNSNTQGILHGVNNMQYGIDNAYPLDGTSNSQNTFGTQPNKFYLTKKPKAAKDLSVTLPEDHLYHKERTNEETTIFISSDTEKEEDNVHNDSYWGTSSSVLVKNSDNPKGIITRFRNNVAAQKYESERIGSRNKSIHKRGRDYSETIVPYSESIETSNPKSDNTAAQIIQCSSAQMNGKSDNLQRATNITPDCRLNDTFKPSASSLTRSRSKWSSQSVILPSQNQSNVEAEPIGREVMKGDNELQVSPRILADPLYEIKETIRPSSYSSKYYRGATEEKQIMRSQRELISNRVPNDAYKEFHKVNVAGYSYASQVKLPRKRNFMFMSREHGRIQETNETLVKRLRSDRQNSSQSFLEEQKMHQVQEEDDNSQQSRSLRREYGNPFAFQYEKLSSDNISRKTCNQNNTTESSPNKRLNFVNFIPSPIKRKRFGVKEDMHNFNIDINRNVPSSIEHELLQESRPAKRDQPLWKGCLNKVHEDRIWSVKSTADPSINTFNKSYFNNSFDRKDAEWRNSSHTPSLQHSPAERMMASRHKLEPITCSVVPSLVSLSYSSPSFVNRHTSAHNQFGNVNQTNAIPSTYLSTVKDEPVNTSQFLPQQYSSSSHFGIFSTQQYPSSFASKRTGVHHESQIPLAGFPTSFQIPLSQDARSFNTFQDNASYSLPTNNFNFRSQRVPEEPYVAQQPANKTFGLQYCDPSQSTLFRSNAQLIQGERGFKMQIEDDKTQKSSEVRFQDGEYFSKQRINSSSKMTSTEGYRNEWNHFDKDMLDYRISTNDRDEDTPTPPPPFYYSNDSDLNLDSGFFWRHQD